MGAAEVEDLPSHMRCVPGSTNISVAKFPSTSGSAAVTNTDAHDIATRFVENINAALQEHDYAAISELFNETGYWRDHLALTWAFRTVQTPTKIRDFLLDCSKSRDGFRLQHVSLDSSSPVRAPKTAALDATGEVTCVLVFLTIKTVIGSGQGVARLVNDEGKWRVFTFYTRLEELKGHEELTYGRRPQSVEHGAHTGRLTWKQRRAQGQDYQDGSEPAVIVLGAGQAGLTAAARLKMLGINTLIVDQNNSIGDNWRNRYDHLVLHDPVWYDHMPYISFPPQWPIFTPKDKLAQFFEAYATLLELNVWMKTEITSSKWDAEGRRWVVSLNRTNDAGIFETRTFHPAHIIQATGHSGKKNQPDFKGIGSFQGYICHSSEFLGAQKVEEQNKKAVIVGCCNSGHDIAMDFLENGYDVTIVQRSTTNVVSSESITEIGLKPLYSEGGPPADDADMLIHSLPTSVLKALQVQIAAKQAANDKEIIDGLEKAGFRVDRGPDDAGLFMKYFQRGGGYYIDVGASKLIAEGKIKVKQGQEIAEILPRGIRFADGSELEANVIILATGYQNMRTQTRTIFGDEVADAVSDVWGLNEEGEMRTIWQSSGHPGFYFHGGNLALCRFYSKALALQIKGLEVSLYKYGEI